jgi:RNA polymerase-binding transcription factor
VTKTENRYEELTRELTEQRKRLLRESKAEILKLLNRGTEHGRVSDEGDLAEMAIEQGLQSSNLNRHRARLSVIESALQKMAEGAYGICEDCGEEIPMGRLRAMTFALRCVDCQEIHEKLLSQGEE